MLTAGTYDKIDTCQS